MKYIYVKYVNISINQSVNQCFYFRNKPITQDIDRETEKTDNENY